MNTVTVELTEAEILHIHTALAYLKNEETRNGQVWGKHTMNAKLRTMMEGAAHKAMSNRLGL